MCQAEFLLLFAGGRYVADVEGSYVAFLTNKPLLQVVCAAALSKADVNKTSSYICERIRYDTHFRQPDLVGIER